MKRFLSLILILSMLLACSGLSAAAADGSAYTQFSDVSADSWYADSVAAVCTAGLMTGSGDTFSPDGQLTAAEALALACRVHSLLTGGDGSFSEGSPWYLVYAEYAAANGLLTEAPTDYTETVTRAEFAQLLSAALPDADAAAISDVDDGMIPDVDTEAVYADAVYRLYRAGILTGGNDGSFRPESSITRAEAAAVLARILDPDSRVSVTLTAASTGTELTAAEIYAKCADAVFYLQVFDENGDAVSSGSGFFLQEDGLAVTNYHVIDEGCSATVTTADGSTYDVMGCYAWDDTCDLALLQVDGSGFVTLDLNTDDVVVGQTAYAIGAPLGLAGTLSVGIISGPLRTINGVTYIQTSAAISSGSSGGVLLNAYGEVLGITTASLTITEGISQNLNLAVPVSYLDDLEPGTLQSIAELAEAAAETEETETPTEAETYANGAPDYGSVTGAECLSSWFEADDRTEEGYAEGADCYRYTHDVQNAADYMYYLTVSGYIVSDSEDTGSGILLIYTLETEEAAVSVGVRVDRNLGGIYIYPY